MNTSGLPQEELAHIWSLADRDQDGRLSRDEFLLAMKMISCRRKGMPLPKSLPPDLEASVAGQGEENGGGFGFGGDGFDFAGPAEDDLSKSKKKGDEDSLNLTDDFHSSKKDKKKGRKDKDSDDGIDTFSVLDKRDRRETRGTAVIDDIYLGGEERRDSGGGDDGVDSIRFDGSSSGAVIGGVVEADTKLSRINNDKSVIGEELKDELVREKMGLEAQMQRKREFEKQVTETRIEMEQMKEERQKIEIDIAANSSDISHFQEEISYLHNQISEMKKEMEEMTKTSQNGGRSVSGDNHSRHSDSSKKSTEHQGERRKEIEELKVTLERLRREKENAQSRVSVLQERQRQADQDRTLLLSAVETERVRLAKIGNERIALSEERQALTESINAIAQHQVMHLGPPTIYRPSRGDRPMYESLPYDESERHHTSGGGWYANTGRDLKGVRSSAVGPPAVTQGNGGGGDGRGRGDYPSNWTTFDSTRSSRRGAGGGGEGRDEDRGIEGILNGRSGSERGERGSERDGRGGGSFDDLTGDYAADRRERERSAYLGTRTSERDNERSDRGDHASGRAGADELVRRPESGKIGRGEAASEGEDDGGGRGKSRRSKKSSKKHKKKKDDAFDLSDFGE
eukprot:GHVN01091443.1.p1 GENE.GHVN01091443.1~~GHVN01091443.1.p1  ORF type:complete len:627 (-),score=152.49 GHVN01091443.1:413-2293(-)